MKRFWLVFLLFVFPAMAADFLPFGQGSRTAIARTHAGKPFVLAYWSVDCAYCMEELKQLDTLTSARPDIALVLVCTDGAEMAHQASDMLARHVPNARAERWMFDDSDPDRLHFAVDRKWHGELPRAYFYDAVGNVRVVAGQVDQRWLKEWVQSVAATAPK